ncbi:MAG: hypothetical protein ACK5XF_04420 [Neisseriaceae bacterium]|jgi:hypothetical protein
MVTYYAVLMNKIDDTNYECGILTSHPHEPLVDDNGNLLRIKLTDKQAIDFIKQRNENKSLLHYNTQNLKFNLGTTQVSK